MNQKIYIRRIDDTLPLPEYKTKGAVAFDLCTRVKAVIEPKQIAYIPLNVNIQNPEGHALIMAPRSSLHKMGLMLINSIGVFDEDFCGNDDEYKAAVYNFTDGTVAIDVGVRLVQIMIIPIAKAEFVEIVDMGKADRGGFGSTGKN